MVSLVSVSTAMLNKPSQFASKLAGLVLLASAGGVIHHRELILAQARNLIEVFFTIPIILRVACGATFFLGILQIVGLLVPAVSPRIDGVAIASPVIGTAMGVAHIVLGWGIFNKQKWTMLIIIILPFLQYGLFYLQEPPSNDILQMNMTMSFGWLVVFALYFFAFGAKSYFEVDANA